MGNYEHTTTSPTEDDDKQLEALGYVPSFKREFSNFATVSPSTALSYAPVEANTNGTHCRLAFRSPSWCVSDLCKIPRPWLDCVLQGLCSSIATTFNTPLTLGGPSSVCRSSPRLLDPSISVPTLSRVLFLLGHLVLDTGRDHGFDFR